MGLVELLYSPKKPEKNLQVHKEHRLVLLLKLEIYYCFLNISQTKNGVIGNLLKTFWCLNLKFNCKVKNKKNVLLNFNKQISSQCSVMCSFQSWNLKLLFFIVLMCSPREIKIIAISKFCFKHILILQKIFVQFEPATIM